MYLLRMTSEFLFRKRLLLFRKITKIARRRPQFVMRLSCINLFSTIGVAREGDSNGNATNDKNKDNKAYCLFSFFQHFCVQRGAQNV